MSTLKDTFAIPLSKGFITIVDRDDFERFGKLKWYANVTRSGKAYAARLETWGRAKAQRKHVKLHRVIMGAGPDNLVDHINGDTLDNRRSNLRIATQAENLRNSAKSNSRSSKFKGVHFDKKTRKWRSQIRVEGKVRSLGFFQTEEEAAKAYDTAAIKNFGEFARPNFVKSRRSKRGAA